MQTFAHGNWQLRLPDDWICEVEDSIATLYHPDGVGELAISSPPTDSAVSRDDLLFLAGEQLEQGVRPTDVELGEFRGIELIYEDGDGNYWREWFLGSDDTLLQISYTCPVGREEKEEGMIDVILATLRKRAAE